MAQSGGLEENTYTTKGVEATDGATINVQPPPYDAGAFSYGAPQNYSNQNYGNPNFGNPNYGNSDYGNGEQVNYGYGMQDRNVPNFYQQPVIGGTTVSTQGYVIQPVMHVQKPPSHLVLSCIVFWLVNMCFGAVAMGFSFSSQAAADRGDMESARKQGGIAKMLSIIGAVFSVLLITTLLVVYFVVVFD